MGSVECRARCGRSAQTRLQAQARGAGQGTFRIARLGALVEDSVEEADKQGAYLAIRSWADATLSWIIPFYGSLKTLWLLWVLVNSNMVRGTDKQRHSPSGDMVSVPVCAEACVPAERGGHRYRGLLDAWASSVFWAPRRSRCLGSYSAISFALLRSVQAIL